MNAIVATFRQRFAAETAEPPEPAINRGTPDPPRRQPPNDAAALPWCREWIPNFESHERQVKASEAHRDELLAKVRAS